MRARQRLARALGIEAGEGVRVAGLFLLSLGNGVFVSCFFLAANFLFLRQLAEEELGRTLPLAYTASAALGFVVVRTLGRLERALSYRRLVTPVQLALLAFTGALWPLTLSVAGRAPAFLLFACVGSCILLADFGFSGLSHRLFDLRQAKRLLGLVTSGEVLASATGFLAGPSLVARLGHPAHLLPIAAAGLACAAGMTALLTRRFAADLEPQAVPEKAADKEPDQAAASNATALLRNPYFTAIGALFLASTLALFLVDMTFLHEIKARSAAHVLSYLYGSIKLAELLFKTLLTGRVLGALGVRGGLLALPAALAPLFALALWVDAGRFFILILIGKWLWLFLRKSVFDPTVRVLYQPLPKDQRLAFQLRLGVVTQLTAVGTGILLFVSARLEVPSLAILITTLLVLLAWIAATQRVHREYRRRLLASLGGASARRPPSPTARIQDALRGGAAPDLGFFAELLEGIDPTAAEWRVLEKLDDDRPQVRAWALRRVAHLGLASAREEAAGCAADGSRVVREQATETLAALDDIASLAADPAQRTRAETAQERRRAAAALGWAEDGEAAASELGALLWDRDDAVRRAALVSAGRLGHPRLWPQVLAHLADPRLRQAASQALLRIGEEALPALEAAYRRADGDPELRLVILGLQEQIGGPAVRDLLSDKLTDPDPAVQRRGIAALAEHRTTEAGGAERAVIFAMIEKAAATTAWNLAASLDLGHSARLAAPRQALEAENRRHRAAVFQLLALLYEPAVVERIRDGLAAEERERRTYALEMLDVLLPPEHSSLVLPLLDDLKPAQRLRHLAASFPQPRQGPVARLEALVHRDPALLGPHAKACAIRALGSTSPEVSQMLLVGLFHPDTLLQELAGREIRKLRPAQWHDIVERLPVSERQPLLESLQGTPEESRAAVLDRALELAAVPQLADLEWRTLFALAEEAERVELAPGEQVPPEDDSAGSIYVIPPPGDTTGAAADAESETPSAVVKLQAARPTPARTLLRLDGDALAERMARSPELLEAVLDLADRDRADRGPATRGTATRGPATS